MCVNCKRSLLMIVNKKASREMIEAVFLEDL
jgi:hypothetical protein